jgi:hypothetical protein
LLKLLYVFLSIVDSNPEGPIRYNSVLDLNFEFKNVAQLDGAVGAGWVGMGRGVSLTLELAGASDRLGVRALKVLTARSAAGRDPGAGELQ